MIQQPYVSPPPPDHLGLKLFKGGHALLSVWSSRRAVTCSPDSRHSCSPLGAIIPKQEAAIPLDNNSGSPTDSKAGLTLIYTSCFSLKVLNYIPPKVDWIFHHLMTLLCRLQNLREIFYCMSGVKSVKIKNYTRFIVNPLQTARQGLQRFSMIKN